MAVFNTHQAFQALMAAGFSERQAQALIDVGSDGYGALATKADLHALEMATKAELYALEQSTKSALDALEQSTKSALDALEQSTKADTRDLDSRLRETELRLRLYVGAYVAIAAALIVAILGFLLALFTGQFE